MLVLSRKIGEQIVIDNGICLKVLAVNGDRVQLGFAVPEDVAILRREVADRTAFAYADSQRPALALAR